MRLISKREVADRVGYHKESLCRLVRQGRFPAPVRVSSSKTLWLEQDVNRWIRERVAASRLENADDQ